MKILVLVLIMLVFVGGVFMYKRPQAFALTPPPFGGKILDIRWCECPVPGYLITVGPPSGGLFIYTPDTILFPNWKIFTPDSWVLGLHSGVPVGCGHYTDYCADQIPTNGIMRIVGTS